MAIRWKQIALLAALLLAAFADCGEAPWSETDTRAIEFKALRLDRFEKNEDTRHEYGRYILEMRKRFAIWMENDDAKIAANSILLAIDEANALIRSQMEHLANEFTEEGRFTERMSKARLEWRDARQMAEGAPMCPKCGKPMRKMVARKGRNAGNPFWSCTGYPSCDGTRRYEGAAR